MTNDIDKQSFGQGGAILLTSAEGALTGEWCAIQCLTDATFTTLTWSKLDTTNGAAITAPTFPQGSVIYGQFAAITVATGTVVAYNAV